eukprot:5606907-Heterocapsa_arctica.AAC.1
MSLHGGPPRSLSKYTVYTTITQPNTSCSSSIQKLKPQPCAKAMKDAKATMKPTHAMKAAKAMKA